MHLEHPCKSKENLLLKKKKTTQKQPTLRLKLKNFEDSAVTTVATLIFLNVGQW